MTDAAGLLREYADHLDLGTASFADGMPTPEWHARCRDLDTELRSLAGDPLRELASGLRGDALLRRVQEARARFEAAALRRRGAVLEALAGTRADRRAQRAYDRSAPRVARYLTRRA